MDSNLVNSLDKYFNVILKNSFNYSDNFITSVHDNMITFETSTRSELINKLSDKKFLNLIENNLYKGINSRYPQYTSININISSPYKFQLILNKYNEFSKLNIDTYIEIASRLDLNGIRRLCESDKNFNYYCNNAIFWNRLILSKYPELFSSFIDRDSKKSFIQIVLYQNILKYSNLKILEKLVTSRQIIHPNPNIVFDFKYRIENDPDLPLLQESLLQTQIQIIKLLSEDQAIFYIKLLSDMHEITYERLDVKTRSGSNLILNSFIFMPDDTKVYKIMMFSSYEKNACTIS